MGQKKEKDDDNGTQTMISLGIPLEANCGNNNNDHVVVVVVVELEMSCSNTTTTNSNKNDDGSSREEVLQLMSSSSKKKRYWMMGRQAKEADIRVNHKSISRQHAALYFLSSELQLHLHDLGGKHGTYINSNRLPSNTSQPLQLNDTFALGNTRYTPTYTLRSITHTSNTNEEQNDTTTTTTKEEEEKNDTKTTTTTTTSLQTDALYQDISEDLTGRARREAEIAASMASLDQTPTYTVPPTTTMTMTMTTQHDNNNNDTKDTTTNNNNNNNNNNDSTNGSKEGEYEKWGLPLKESLWLDRVAAAGGGKNIKTSKYVVSCVAWDASGSRLVVGSFTDARLRFYDISTDPQKCFKQVQVGGDDLHLPIVSICFSCTGHVLYVATTSCQPVVLDRDGNMIRQFIQGDVYLRDMTKTTGHIASVTSIQAHPFLPHQCLTGSHDGSARLWDIQKGKTQFQRLCCSQVYHWKQTQYVTCAQFSPSAQQLAMSTQSGTIQIWNTNKNTHRPIQILQSNSSIHSMAHHLDGTYLATRSTDQSTISIWHLGSSSSSSSSTSNKQQQQQQQPYAICSSSSSSISLASSHDFSNLSFGTTASTKNILCIPTESNQLIFFQLPNNNNNNNNNNKNKKKAKNNSSPIQLNPISIYNVGTNNTKDDDSESESDSSKKKRRCVAAIAVQWHSKLNQLVCVGTQGHVKLCFHSRLSRKTSHYAQAVQRHLTRDTKDLRQLLESRAHQGYANMSSSQLPIQHPLLMNHHHHTRNKRKLLEEDETILLPHPPATGIASGEASSANLNFQQYVVSKQIKLNLGKDPRQELFAYHNNNNNKNTKSFGLDNEPKILATKTAEQEEDELKQQQQQQL